MSPWVNIFQNIFDCFHSCIFWQERLINFFGQEKKILKNLLLNNIIAVNDPTECKLYFIKKTSIRQQNFKLSCITFQKMELKTYFKTEKIFQFRGGKREFHVFVVLEEKCIFLRFYHFCKWHNNISFSFGICQLSQKYNRYYIILIKPSPFGWFNLD